MSSPSFCHVIALVVLSLTSQVTVIRLSPLVRATLRRVCVSSLSASLFAVQPSASPVSTSGSISLPFSSMAAGSIALPSTVRESGASSAGSSLASGLGSALCCWATSGLGVGCAEPPEAQPVSMQTPASIPAASIALLLRFMVCFPPFLSW